MTAHTCTWRTAPLIVAMAAAAVEPVQAQTTAAFEYSMARFDNDLDMWHQLALEARHETPGWTALARANFARRFGQNGQQLEAKLYPRLAEATYLYLGYGFSTAEIFPEMRYGAELFHGIRPGVEASVGARYLDFDARNVALYTGSIAWYPRNFYVAVRPFISPFDGDLLVSGNLHVRRYLDTEEQWVALTAGGGKAPGESVTQLELERIRSLSALLYGRLRAGAGLGLRWSAGYEWEQLSSERDRGRIMLGVGMERRF